MESAIGINMCRCCGSEGSYKDLNTKFIWMGETEIYADMLQYCFDINLEMEESDNGGICEVCITQLRHATNFKEQVLITEEKFKKRLQEKVVSRDAIKLEMNEVSIDSDNDNRVMDDYSEPGDAIKLEMNEVSIDSDNDNCVMYDFLEPEYDILIKEEIDVEVKPKKRSAEASTSTTSSVKKPKHEEDERSNKQMQRTKATATQINYLIEHMKANPECAVGRANGLQGRVKLEEQWKSLISILNSLGGPVKSEEKWKQTWRDIRNTLKKKALKDKNEVKDDRPECTGNGQQAHREVFTAQKETVTATVEPVAISGSKGAPCTMPISQSAAVTVTADTRVLKRTVKDHIVSVLSTKPLSPSRSRSPSRAAHTAQNQPRTKTSHWRRRRLTSRIDAFDREILDIEKERLEIQKKQLLIEEAKVKALERLAAAFEEYNRNNK